jgi:hypothetical protein
MPRLGPQPALALDPVELGRLVSPANGRVHLDPATRLTGKLTLRGREATDEERRELERAAANELPGDGSKTPESGEKTPGS